MTGRVLLALVLAGVACAVPASVAHAYFDPGATIASASLQRLEEGDADTTQAVLSADGRYVVFTTRARNLFADDDADPPGAFRFGGVFRRDMATGALELVAHGDLRDERDPDDLMTRGALNPSVSADGRFVAFSTGEQLVPADTNGHVDVYVRDMAVPASASGAYDLVSARDGGATPASYEAPAPGDDQPGVNPGAELTVRSAISADGRFVVFRTPFTASDLPAATGAVTPGGQVFVRDRQSRRTVLITKDRTTGDPVGGGIGAATISTDGSTILWLGRAAPAQSPFLTGEFLDDAITYLLWRRWDDAGAVTRRVTGASDVDDPGCPPGSTYSASIDATGPCYGPLSQTEDYLGAVNSGVPAMSADGRRVAFVTAAPPRGVGVGNGADAFLADMSPGVSRKAGTIELTRDGLAVAKAGLNIEGVAMSADARLVALTTFRTQFVLPSYPLVDRERGTADQRELYLIDVPAHTIERVLHGYDGDDVDGSVDVVPAMSASGSRIAFTSDASNLFFGDANNSSDAFVVDRRDAPPALPPFADPGDATVLDAPAVQKATAKPAKLSVTVRRGANGLVRLLVRAPAAGRVSAVARGRGLSAAGRLTGRARTLAAATAQPKRKTQVTLRLRLSKAMRSRLRRAGKLIAQADVRFTPRTGRAAARLVTIEFRP